MMKLWEVVIVVVGLCCMFSVVVKRIQRDNLREIKCHSLGGVLISQGVESVCAKVTAIDLGK